MPVDGPESQSDGLDAGVGDHPADEESAATAAHADPDAAPETFPREYVEQLRGEAAAARVKAKRAEGLAERLTVALAAQDGRLADPTDFPYSTAVEADGYPTPELVGEAIGRLLELKPHLASRTPRGDVGQGAKPEDAPPVSLLSMFR